MWNDYRRHKNKERHLRSPGCTAHASQSVVHRPAVSESVGNLEIQIHRPHPKHAEGEAQRSHKPSSEPAAHHSMKSTGAVGENI